MDKKGRFTIWLISIVALTMSVASVCVACFRTGDLGFDYQGVIVGVLSLLVTALIGWQIYSTIAMEERMRKVADSISAEKTYNLQRKLYGELSDTYDSLTITAICSTRFLDSLLYNNQHAICALCSKDTEKAKKVIENMFVLIGKIKNGNEIDEQLLNIIKEHAEKLDGLVHVYPKLARPYLRLLQTVNGIRVQSRQ